MPLGTDDIAIKDIMIFVQWLHKGYHDIRSVVAYYVCACLFDRYVCVMAIRVFLFDSYACNIPMLVSPMCLFII